MYLLKNTPYMQLCIHCWLYTGINEISTFIYKILICKPELTKPKQCIRVHEGAKVRNLSRLIEASEVAAGHLKNLKNYVVRNFQAKYYFWFICTYYEILRATALKLGGEDAEKKIKLANFHLKFSSFWS